MEAREKVITTEDDNSKEKTIYIGDNRNLKVRVSKDPVSYDMRITEGFKEEGRLVRTYELFQGDDYIFNIWSEDDYENFNTVSFKFDINHPLYMPLFHLLNYDRELVIEDDETREDCQKYMVIYIRDEYIFVDFNNFIEYTFSPTSEEKFRVFVKNILHDGRSKIDRDYKDTKYRLYRFFSEVYSRVMKENRQISIEEYMLLKSIEDENMEHVFKAQYELPFQRTRNND